MLKIFYNPSYVRLKRLGTTRAIFLSTVVVFLMTWFLHAYQWFWLRGSFLLTPVDILFWTILAVLMITNILWGKKKASIGEKPGILSKPYEPLNRSGDPRSCAYYGHSGPGMMLVWFALWSIGTDLQNVAILLLSVLIIMSSFFALILEKFLLK
jgi:hypothetical protein